MGFKVTYADGHDAEYDSRTHFEIDGGVLKMGAIAGQWTLYVSPSYWSTIDADPPEPKEPQMPRRIR